MADPIPTPPVATPPVVTPPVVTPPAVVPPPVATPPTTTWSSDFDDDLKGYVQNKGFAGPKEAVEAYRNLEKIHGVPISRLLTLPESMEGDEANAIWERLGAPKEAKEYNIEIPEAHGDADMAEWAKDTFHKLKVPRSMAENFTKAWNERQAASIKEFEESTTHEIKQEHDALKKEWGAAYEQNETIANQAAAKFGINKEQAEALGAALGPSAALKFLHKLGVGTGEAAFIEGGGVAGTKLTPEQAKTQIGELIKDTDFQRRVQSGDTDARARWDRLHQAAAPGQMTI